jgi:hypothetical protein
MKPRLIKTDDAVVRFRKAGNQAADPERTHPGDRTNLEARIERNVGGLAPDFEALAQ